jgi:hypothetical protein
MLDIERPEENVAACNPVPSDPTPSTETIGGIGLELGDVTLIEAVETKPNQISQHLAQWVGRDILPLIADGRLPTVGV